MSPEQRIGNPQQPKVSNGQGLDRLSRSGINTPKLAGLPLKTTVAGAAVLATLRAFWKRRVSRKKHRNQSSTRKSATGTTRTDLGATTTSSEEQTSVPPPNTTSTAPDSQPTRTRDAPEMNGDVIDKQRAAAQLGGGRQRIDAQHQRGKLVARERIERILDDDTSEEMAPYVEHRHSEFGLDRRRHPGDGVVTGFGRIDGCRVAIFAKDFTILGDSFSETQALKVGRLLESATTAGQLGSVIAGGVLLALVELLAQ